MGTTKTVPLDRITWSEPARPVDPAHVKELANSIKEIGLLQRIGVVDAGGETYEGRLGRHRYEAVKSLGAKTIDVEVLDLGEVEQRIARIHENVKRRGLSPVERAKALKAYLEARRVKEPTLTQEAVAKELQISPPEFSNTLRILDQDPRVQALVDQGRLTAGHVEAAIGPLKDKLPKDAVVKFAHEIARTQSDVRTAKKGADRLLEQHRTALAAEAAIAAAKAAGAKVVFCPACAWTKQAPDKSYEAEGRLVLAHSDPYVGGGERHRWYGDTGEPYLTPAERKEDDRHKAEIAKARKKAKPDKREKLVRDYAVFFSRAPIADWAQALLNEAKASLNGLKLGAGSYVRYDPQATAHGLRVDATIRGLPVPVGFEAVDFADGKGKRFVTRVRIGEYRSTPSEPDNVVEGGDVAKLRKARADLLAFQRKRVGTRQADGDLWPVSVGGFALGEKVKIGEKAAWSSYVGKQGTILAFDLEAGLDRGAGKDVAAVLDIGSAHKRHRLSSLKKLEKRGPRKAPAPPRRGA